MKRLLHRWMHFWNARTESGQILHFTPEDGGGFFIARHCTVCRLVQVKAFALCGDKKWHGLDTIGLHCWTHELVKILRGLRHHKIIVPECPEAFYAGHHHLLIKRTGDISCECACGCGFDWASPYDWKIIKHGCYFKP